MTRICLAAGAASVLVYDHLTDLPDRTLEINGIAPAARAAGAPVKAYATSKPGPGRTITIPGASAIVNPAIMNEVLDADFIINMPKAKHHSGALLSLSPRIPSAAPLVEHGEACTTWTCTALSAKAEHGSQAGPDRDGRHQHPLNPKRSRRSGKIATPGEVIVGRDPGGGGQLRDHPLGKQAGDIPYILRAAELGVGTTGHKLPGSEEDRAMTETGVKDKRRLGLSILRGSVQLTFLGLFSGRGLERLLPALGHLPREYLLARRAAQRGALPGGAFGLTFVLPAIILLLLTLPTGRFFCGWICPAGPAAISSPSAGRHGKRTLKGIRPRGLGRAVRERGRSRLRL